MKAGPIAVAVALSLLVSVSGTAVLAQPAPGWNRRLTGISLTENAGGGFDVTVEWRIDLEGSAAVPVELGTAVDLSIAGGPPTTTTENECLIWELDAGGAFDCTGQPDGTMCGTASISGTPVSLTCDADTETCSTPLRTVAFPGVPLIPKDEIVVLLRPAPGAMPDSSPTDDDDGLLTFGSWNRKMVSLDVVSTPGGGPDQFDVTAEIVIEIDAESTVPLNLSIDTEPVPADPCCQEACCCPSCSTECSGNGCGGSGGSGGTLTVSNIGSSGAPVPCVGAPCSGTCAEGTQDGAPFSLSCDPTDCVCRSETVTLSWTGLSFQPNDEIFIILRPAPGALPELPPFDDDSMTAIVPGPVPTVSAWGMVVMALLVFTVGTVFLHRRRPVVT